MELTYSKESENKLLKVAVNCNMTKLEVKYVLACLEEQKLVKIIAE